MLVMICNFLIFRSSHRSCSVKKDVLGNFAEFTGKQLCQSLFCACRNNHFCCVGHGLLTLSFATKLIPSIFPNLLKRYEGETFTRDSSFSVTLVNNTNNFVTFSSVWNKGQRSAFAGQMCKTSGHFCLDFGENIRTKLCFYRLDLTFHRFCLNQLLYLFPGFLKPWRCHAETSTERANFKLCSPFYHLFCPFSHLCHFDVKRKLVFLHNHSISQALF